jgi:hypothetical protein
VQDDLEPLLKSINAKVYKYSLRTLEITALPGTGVTELIKGYADKENIDLIHIDASEIDAKNPLRFLVYLNKPDFSILSIVIVENSPVEMGHPLLNMTGTKDVAILHIKQDQ